MAMKLMTRKIERELSRYPIYSQDGRGMDAVAVVKFFIPASGFTMYVTEGNRLPDGGWEFYGLTVNGPEMEFGYCTLAQLEAVRGRWGLRMERDRYFRPCALKEALRENGLTA